jgi:hypothetical protein
VNHPELVREMRDKDPALSKEKAVKMLRAEAAAVGTAAAIRDTAQCAELCVR